jgi:2-polyprenyl-6-methoxyphenol hydroxylase-like FAD-dependent oxidoreductase
MNSYDVVVAGAGPVGLLLAGDLAEAGRRVLVLDRLPGPGAEPKANAVVGQAARLLRHRGLPEWMGLAGSPAASSVFQFGGIPLDLASVPEDPLHGMPVTQRGLETALAERAAALGAELRRPCELLDWTEEAGSVSARIRDEAGDSRVGAAYLVGCDGASSRVRDLAGIGFPGVTDAEVVSRTAEAILPGAEVRPREAAVEVPGVGRLGLYQWHRTDAGAWVMMPRPGGSLLVSVMEWGGEPSVAEEPEATVEEVSEALERVLGTPIPLRAPEGPGPHQLRRWRGRNTRIASSYRHGRVLLAGDAAHVHNAVGAPGLNVGLQDAACLAWRLAATLRGAGDLLPDYEAERRPAAERVAMQTQVQTLLLSPGSAIASLRTLLTELFEEPAVTGRMARLLEGSDVVYPTGPGAHPLVGRFVPDVGDLDARLGSALPALVDFGGWSEPVPPGLTVVRLPPGDRSGSGGREVVGMPVAALVRPDGYVAWAAEECVPEAAAGLRRAVAELSGTPR